MSSAAARVCETPIDVLIVSSNHALRRELSSCLGSQPQWRLVEAMSGAHALECLESERCEVVLLDPNLPDLDSTELQELVGAQFPQTQVLVLEDNGLREPTNSLLNDASRRVVDMLVESNPNSKPRSAQATAAPYSRTATYVLPGMIGDSEAMQRVYYMTELVARRDTTVLISGASGTGKDLVAQAIHQLSPRRANPFVVINCAAIPETLLEAELFGYVKGAFTGAMQSRVGRIHSAQGGVLFLDEIGELPLSLQSKLLRFLEQGEVQRLGSSDTFRVDVRVIAATNVNLRKLVEEQKFREDLYYRLAVFPIGLPLLKDRLEDLPALAWRFVEIFSSARMSLSQEAVGALMEHSWPGNVRELRNVIERATILANEEAEIGQKHILI